MKKLTKPKKVVIDRRKWMRGTNDDASMLLNPLNGKMCCLGFMMLDSGADEEDIAEMGMPAALARVGTAMADFCVNPWIDPEKTDNQSWVYDAARVNDTDKISESEREREIRKIFNDQDIEVEFVN